MSRRSWAYAAYQADRTDHRLLAITITGLLSCTMPPLALGSPLVWMVPLLAVALDRVVRSAGPVRWAWTGTAAVIYVVTFMWFNARRYRTANVDPIGPSALHCRLQRRDRSHE